MHPRRRSRHALVSALVGIAGVIATLLVPAPTAQASSTILCKGFTACEAAGYSSFGYGPSNYKKMWWRMYSGHNCTNYMAYRMIKAGMPTERPWSGSGDARNWGVVFKSKVNQTPKVGSVAWWSSNHVAYVQQIIDADTIIISEDHYRGDFDWRKITRAGGGWPTGFIHLADEAVTATEPPAITGTPKVDEPLVADPGLWNQPGATYRYQWLAGGQAISGATEATYTPTPTQVGETFAVRVRAIKAGFKRGAATSAASEPTVPGTLTASGEPVISGVPKVGAVLTASVPELTPEPQAQTYAWFASGKYISGVRGTSLTLTPALLGKVIRFVVKASAPGYEDLTSPSARTEKVGPEKLTVTEEPSLSGNPHVGKPFTVASGAVTPDATTSYQWYSQDVPIPGATASTYTPTVADARRRLSVVVSYTRPGYTTVVRELTSAQPVRAIGWMYVRSTAHKTVTIKVVAEGIRTVRGQVVLIARNGARETATLVRGTASISTSWIYRGSRTYTVEYLGSPKVEKRTRIVTIAVK